MADVLYNELLEFIKSNISNEDFVKLIDLDRYKDIYLYPTEKLNNTLTRKLPEATLHISITRKIHYFDCNILYIIATKLTQPTDIIKFFSYYDTAEIINIITMDIAAVPSYDTKYTMLFYCMTYSNDELFIHILDYAKLFNMSLYPDIILPGVHNVLHEMHDKLALIDEHEYVLKKV